MLSPSSSLVHFFLCDKIFHLSPSFLYICLTVNRGIHHFDKLWELTIHLIMKNSPIFFIFLFQNVFHGASERKNRCQFVTIKTTLSPWFSFVCIISTYYLLMCLFYYFPKAVIKFSSHSTFFLLLL